MVPHDDIRSDELSRCLFDESNDAFFVVDPEGLVVLDANPTARRFTGQSRQELIGQSLEGILTGDTEEATAQMIAGCQNTTFFHSQDGYCLRTLSGQRHVNVTVSRLHGESKIWSLVVVRDVTKQKELEASLQESNERYRETLEELCRSRDLITRQAQQRAVGHLADGVAHDLNNLLSPIVTYAEILLAVSGSNEVARRQLGVIAKSARDAAESVRRLQRFRVDEQSQRRPVDIAKLIREIPDLTRPRWESEQRLHGGPIEFELEIADDLPAVAAVESELRQVLLNLALNAVDAMPEGGRLRISALADDAEIRIEVVDTGTGMTREQCDRCMDAFFTTRLEGAGLGLSLSVGVIENHGGRLEVESELGFGSTFRITLPVSRSAEKERSTPQSVGTVDQLSVLCIDDDDQVRDSLQVLLETMGLTVSSAADGETGLRMFADSGYDVVITDLGMSGLTGWDVIRAIRQSSPETATCVLSGWPLSEITRQTPGDARPDQIFLKPVVASELQLFLDGVAATKSRAAEVGSAAGTGGLS